MLYEELQALVNHKATYEEFEAINTIYTAACMEDAEMTHADCAALWEHRFGKAQRAAERKANKARKERLELVLAYADTCQDRPREVWDILNGIQDAFRKNDAGNPWAGDYYTDEFGLIWFRQFWRKTPNGCWKIYHLYVQDSKGNKADTCYSWH